jgi:hypothetical protein
MLNHAMVGDSEPSTHRPRRLARQRLPLPDAADDLPWKRMAELAYRDDDRRLRAVAARDGR